MSSLIHSFMDDEETSVNILHCAVYCLEMNVDLTEVELTGPLGGSGKTIEKTFRKDDDEIDFDNPLISFSRFLQ